jgi:hypothetical protein
MSLVEDLANIAVGYLVALATQLAVFPAVGLEVSLGQNLVIGALFSAVSIARSYALRRLFEAIRERHPQRKTAAPSSAALGAPCAFSGSTPIAASPAPVIRSSTARPSASFRHKVFRAGSAVAMSR